MDFQEFLESKKVEYTKNLVNREEIITVEKELGLSFGDEMIAYLLEYGYLAYRHIELYGIDSVQLMESDMVKQTKYLHKYFPKTKDFIALENIGDGVYAVVAPDDEVFEYSSEGACISDTGYKLFDYILKRFKDIDVE